MKLGIYGSGGLGREIYEIACRKNAIAATWTEIVFVDDFRAEGSYFGTKVIRPTVMLNKKEDYECLVAVGEPSARSDLYNKLVASNVRLAKLVDPSAIISPSAILNQGVIVCEYSTIHTGVSIGANSLIQPFCDIGHDITVGSNSVLSPYCVPGGGVAIGDRVFVGLHCSIKESLTVGNDAIIAMGSVVFNDVPSGSTVVGNPARITKGSTDRKVFVSTR